MNRSESKRRTTDSGRTPQSMYTEQIHDYMYPLDIHPTNQCPLPHRILVRELGRFKRHQRDSLSQVSSVCGRRAAPTQLRLTPARTTARRGPMPGLCCKRMLCVLLPTGVLGVHHGGRPSTKHRPCTTTTVSTRPRPPVPTAHACTADLLILLASFAAYAVRRHRV